MTDGNDMVAVPREVLKRARDWIADGSRPYGLPNPYHSAGLYSVTMRLWAKTIEDLDTALTQTRSEGE